MGKPRTKIQGLPHGSRKGDDDLAEVEIVLEMLSQPLQNMLDKLLTAIADAKTVLQREISTMAIELVLLQAHHSKLVDRVKDFEMVLSEKHLAQKAMSAQLRTLTERVNKLEQ
ncbi:hypothetical protein NDU88_006008 [Pleurodeles waltl]|uniref:Uncharacterized protein n=1 Tax=Pleurodeles waltl TaxID=8319 RepID=A0AAV7MIK5_PLEWA|nr:hypothetical protein NDU88_006008 [Pleurodeles waltl]